MTSLPALAGECADLGLLLHVRDEPLDDETTVDDTFELSRSATNRPHRPTSSRPSDTARGASRRIGPGKHHNVGMQRMRMTLTEAAERLRAQALRPRTAWIAGGLAVAAIAVLGDIGRGLRSIEQDGRAFGPEVFFGFKIAFWDTDELRSALALWHESGMAAERLVRTHAIVDLVFIAAYCLLLWRLLTHAYTGEASHRANKLACAVLLADVAETIMTLVILPGADPEALGDGILVALQITTFGKWVALAVAIVALPLAPRVRAKIRAVVGAIS